MAVRHVKSSDKMGKFMSFGREKTKNRKSTILKNAQKKMYICLNLYKTSEIFKIKKKEIWFSNIFKKVLKNLFNSYCSHLSLNLFFF